MFRVAVSCLCVLLGGAAWADEPVRVALVTGSTRDPFSARLAAELQALGLASATVEWQDVPLDEVARAHEAAAVTRPIASGRGLEVWIDERASGRPMVRHLVVDERPDGPDVTMVVMQTAELLRSSFQKRPEEPVVVERAAAPAPPVAVPVAPRTHVAGGAGLGVSMQSGDFDPVPVGRVDLAWLSRGGWGLEVLGQFPWTSATLSAIEGQTQVRPFLAALGLRLGGAQRALFADVALGVAGQWWSVRGEATGSLIGREENVLVPAGYARLRVGWAPLAWLHAGVEGLALVTASSTDVVHAGRSVGTLGSVGGTVLLGCEVRTP